MKKRISTTINALIFVVIALTVPILSFQGVIDQEWTNRLGIILNFAAGFLIAPELLGLERLRKAETSIETIAAKFGAFLERPRFYIRQSLRQQNSALITTTVLVAILICLVETIFIFRIVLDLALQNWPLPKTTLRSIGLFVFVGLMFFLSAIYLIYFWAEETKQTENIIAKLQNGKGKPILQIYRRLNQNSVIAFLSIFARPLAAPGLLILIIPFAILYVIFLLLFVIISIIRAPFTFVIKKLSGDDKLESVLTWWGVLFFISGNLLQLIATL
jgi:hypothetical protein